MFGGTCRQHPDVVVDIGSHAETCTSRRVPLTGVRLLRREPFSVEYRLISGGVRPNLVSSFGASQFFNGLAARTSSLSTDAIDPKSKAVSKRSIRPNTPRCPP